MTASLVAKPDLRVLTVLWQLAAHHGRVWCYPSQETIRTLLQRFHARRMSRRTINRHLRALVAQGYIERIRRHIKQRSGELLLRSTVYTLLPRARRLIVRAARAAHQLIKAGAKWLIHSAVPLVAQHGTPSVTPLSPPGGSAPSERLNPPPRRARPTAANRSTPPARSSGGRGRTNRLSRRPPPSVVTP